jgi:predicted DNA binding CopG/RHH family protein
MTYKPMTFSIDRNLPTPAALITKPQPERKQISARITAATYRQLKARAALEGMTVQTLVERAIDQFLATGARQ